MKAATSILCCFAFVFVFGGTAFAEICQGSHPEKCLQDHWHDWETHHVHIKECVDRLSAAGDAHPIDDCAVEHFCGSHGESHAACEKAVLDHFHHNPQLHDEVAGWLKEAGHH